MKKLFVFLFAIHFFNLTYAQNYQFKGKVIDKNTKKTLPFVAVTIVGDNKGVQTDIDGKFIFKSNKSSLLLRFQYVGYQSKEQTLKANEETEVILSIKENV